MLEEPVPHTPGGNADRYQNKGVAGKAIRKTMKTKGRQNQAAAKTDVVEGKKEGETGTLSPEPCLDVTVSVTICQVIN
jgi:hypothetical protein